MIGASGRQSIASQKKRAGTVVFDSDDDEGEFYAEEDIDDDHMVDAFTKDIVSNVKKCQQTTAEK